MPRKSRAKPKVKVHKAKVLKVEKLPEPDQHLVELALIVEAPELPTDPLPADFIELSPAAEVSAERTGWDKFFDWLGW